MQRQDVRGLEGLLQLHGPRVAGSLGLTGADRSLVEDAVHDAALILWRVSARLDPGSGLRSYFTTVARRELLRKRKAEDTRLVVIDTAVVESTATESRVQEPSPRSVAGFDQALAGLSPTEADVLALDVGSNFTATAAGVAEAMQTTAATVYSARKRIKDKLGHLVGADKRRSTRTA